MIIVIHHNDDDGLASAFLVKYFTKNTNIKFIEMNYSKKLPIEDISVNDIIYIVDYSISPEEMTQLLTITKNVTWIDHHETAIDAYKNFKQKIAGLRSNIVSASALTYMYFITKFNNTGIYKFSETEIQGKLPIFLKYINDFDMFQFKYKDTLDFHNGLNLYNTKPESKIWNELMNNNDKLFIEIINKGKIITKYDNIQSLKYINDYGYICEFEKHKCFVINMQNISSINFTNCITGNYDIYVKYVYNGKAYSVSLYAANDNINVGKIAKKYGGGGHKGSAGFTINKLPNELLIKL